MPLLVSEYRSRNVDVHFLELSKADCLPKCWDNSKYVTACRDDGKCFCQDDEYQSVSEASSICGVSKCSCPQVVFQCIYSQCPSAHFGSALHIALTNCSEFDTMEQRSLPPLLRQQSLRKRVLGAAEHPAGSLSAYAPAYTTDHSSMSAPASESNSISRLTMTRSAAASASDYITHARQTRSIPLPTTFVYLSSESSILLTHANSTITNSTLV